MIFTLSVSSLDHIGWGRVYTSSLATMLAVSLDLLTQLVDNLADFTRDLIRQGLVGMLNTDIIAFFFAIFLLN